MDSTLLRQIIWSWPKTGWIKKETEGILSAAQDQALPTRNYKAVKMGESGTKKCRMCRYRDHTPIHILSKCEKLTRVRIYDSPLVLRLHVVESRHATTGFMCGVRVIRTIPPPLHVNTGLTGEIPVPAVFSVHTERGQTHAVLRLLL